MARRASGAQNSVKPRRKQGGKGKPFAPGNPWRFHRGQSGNAGGRPKLLSDAHREWLAAEDKQGVTNAARVALVVGDQALGGDIQAVKEIRQATEGERIRTWRDDIVDLLRKGEITPNDVITELGADEAQPLIAAAGIRRDEGGSPEGKSSEATAPGETE